jgi:hypothetical protein
VVGSGICEDIEYYSGSWCEQVFQGQWRQLNYLARGDVIKSRIL